MKEKDKKQKIEISRRLQESMDRLHMNATDLSAASGIGKSDISNYLNAKYKPKQDKIALLALALGVDPAWLYALDVQLGTNESEQEYLLSSAQQSLENDRKELGKAIKRYRELGNITQNELAKSVGISASTIAMYETGQREPNITILKSIAKNLSIRTSNLLSEPGNCTVPDNLYSLLPLDTHRIPVVGSVAAGEPIYDEEYDAYVDGPLKADCALKVKGESMVPTFQDGDLLYVRIQPDVDYDGQVAAVIVGEEATVKHVYRQEEGLMLLSDNPKYPPMFKRFADYDDQIRVLGKVIGFTRLWE